MSARLGLAISFAITTMLPARALALPMYALASAHTCGNCHVSPTAEDRFGWDDPGLAERKCNLSCMSCHVNPTGGGLRNSSGRYFAQSSLSMVPLQERSYSDDGRELLSPQQIESLRALFNAAPRAAATSQPAAESYDPGQGTIPSGFEDVEKIAARGNAKGGWAQLGHSLDGPSRYGFWDGRYGDLNADPLLSFGADLRFAYYTANTNFFPMETDLDAALHPLEHLTLMATLAGRGRATGFAATVDQPRAPIFLRNAFILAHELPYMMYAKAGVFLPSFGTFIDDHTSFIRRYFDLDLSTSDNTVLGVELGFAPNYPFASVSAFRGMTPYGAPEGTGGGYGGALNLGWRALGWSLSAHAMIKRRDLAAGGDLDAAGIAWGFNPGYFLDALPFSLLGEFSVGRRKEDALFPRSVDFYAFYSELWWFAFNGVNVRAKYDLGRRDLDQSAEREQRLSFALDVSPVPGLTLIPMFRLLFPADSTGTKADLLVQLHAWF